MTKEDMNTNDYLSITNLEVLNQYLYFYVTVYNTFCIINIHDNGKILFV